MIENILNYQKLDTKLYNLERSLREDEAKKVVSNMIAFVKSEQSKLLSIENDAKNEVKNFEQLNKEYEDSVKILDELVKIKVEALDDNQTREIADRINQITNKINILERKINTFKDKVNNILKSFENTKKSIVVSKQKYKESKEKYDKKVAELTPEIDKLNKELKKLESGIDKNLLSRYKQTKQDNIFPVFVPVISSTCGGCRMEISHALMQKLKDKGYIECEQCHRIIYL